MLHLNTKYIEHVFQNYVSQLLTHLTLKIIYIFSPQTKIIFAMKFYLQIPIYKTDLRNLFKNYLLVADFYT